MVTVKLGDISTSAMAAARRRGRRAGRFPVYGANGAIGYSAEHNASGPLIVLGRVGSYCGSLHYCDSDIWVTDNAMVCRAMDPERPDIGITHCRLAGSTITGPDQGSRYSTSEFCEAFRSGPPTVASAGGSPNCSARSTTKSPPTGA